MRDHIHSPTLARAGFTIIELMIVVVVIGVLAAIAVPRFQVLALRAEAAEAPPVLRQICTLAEASRMETRAWPAAAGADGLEGLSGWADPGAGNFDFSYSVSDGVGHANASPKATANPLLEARSMDCGTREIR